MQKPRLVPFGLACIVLSFVGCGMTANKQAAEATAAKLYQAWSEKNWDAVMGLYSPQFYGKISKEQWHSMILALHQKLGDYKNHRLTGWQGRSHAGTGGSSQATVLTYQVTYANGEATETLTFLGSGEDGILKISGHQINSPALILPAAAPKPAAPKDQGRP